MVLIPWEPAGSPVAPLSTKIDNYQWRCVIQPPVAAELWSSEIGLHVRFKVFESQPLVTVLKQQEPPALTCKDSAVEVFLAFPLFEDEPNFKPQLDHCLYTNIEVNAAGVCYAEYGVHREGRSTYSTAQVADLQIATQIEPTFWTCSLVIPRTLIRSLVGYDGLQRSFGLNLYKISESPEQEHYVSWQKVASTTPNFHLPESFAVVQCAPQPPSA